MPTTWSAPGSSGILPCSPTRRLGFSRRQTIGGALWLIDDLHELSRAEMGCLALTVEPVNLAVVVRELFEEYHAAAQTRGLSLSIELEELEPIANTDESRVRQIAANLVSNAIKYGRPGTEIMIGADTVRRLS